MVKEGRTGLVEERAGRDVTDKRLRSIVRGCAWLGLSAASRRPRWGSSFRPCQKGKSGKGKRKGGGEEQGEGRNRLT